MTTCIDKALIFDNESPSMGDCSRPFLQTPLERGLGLVEDFPFLLGKKIQPSFFLFSFFPSLSPNLTFPPRHSQCIRFSQFSSAYKAVEGIRGLASTRLDDEWG
jgi:hypothetical protein